MDLGICNFSICDDLDLMYRIRQKTAFLTIDRLAQDVLDKHMQKGDKVV